MMEGDVQQPSEPADDCDHCGAPVRGENPQFRAHRHLDVPPLLEARALQAGFGQRAILPPIDFRLHAGEFWALIGRNGSGKTTLIRTLLGLLPAVRGSVRRRSGLRTGYVPQRDAFDLDLPARAIDVLRGGLDSGWSFLNPLHARRTRDAVHRVGTDLELLPLLDHPFRELSEGQKQRVLMARALVSKPHILVLDEPTSAMDIVAERDTFRLIDQIRREQDIGIIVVSHHLALVASHATDILFVDREDGTALAGCIEDVAGHPAFTRRFSAFDCGVPGAHAAHAHAHA
ncbi:MAG: metal ABC transporter ATP-binding protein [Deltaproteobacteria bacterium]|nr:MAG: metal ABC transporter ATP-binding protein [Deltaproteobacteria bacterium]